MATAREKLEARAGELGIEFTEETTNAELKELIAQKEDAGDEGEGESGKKKAKRGSFVVLDGNGKEVRTVDSEEEAVELAKVYSGRYTAV